MNLWLIQHDTLAALKSAPTPTASAVAEFTAAYYAQGEYPGARIMSKAGDTAEIRIAGTLTKNPDWMAEYFGGGNTTYTDIMAALGEAERDPAIKKITLAINSPGGSTAGMFETVDMIAAATKPVEARVDMAASAAYAIASQADRIVANSRAASLGSIGIAATMVVDDSVVDITSTDAPNKRPDVTTDDGRVVIREYLDEMHALFVETIARGRGIEPEKVNSDYGRGSMFLADSALNRGMIDAIETQQTAAPSGKTEAKIMDLNTLKAQHPAVYAEACKEAVDAERDRVNAHLIMGETSGAMATAIDAIKTGAGMTATLNATYLSAALNKGNTTARADDEQTTAAAANGTSAPAPDAAQTESMKVYAMVAEQLGVNA